MMWLIDFFLICLQVVIELGKTIFEIKGFILIGLTMFLITEAINKRIMIVFLYFLNFRKDQLVKAKGESIPKIKMCSKMHLNE